MAAPNWLARDWTGAVSATPVVPIAAGETWREKHCYAGFIICNDGIWSDPFQDSSGYYYMSVNGGETDLAHGGEKNRVGFFKSLTIDGTWVACAANPYLDVGAAGKWDDTDFHGGTIMYDTSTDSFKCWYAGADYMGTPTSSEDDEIGYATCAGDTPDNTWTKISHMTGIYDPGGIITIDDGDASHNLFDGITDASDGLYQPCVWKEGASDYRMILPLRATTQLWTTYYLTSTDGIHWSTPQKVTVSGFTAVKPWVQWVYEYNGTYYAVVWDNAGASSDIFVGVFSADFTTLTKDYGTAGDDTSGKILYEHAGFASTRVYWMRPVRIDGTWWAVYSGYDGTNAQTGVVEGIPAFTATADADSVNLDWSGVG